MDLLVIDLKCTPFKLQRLYLPISVCSSESGKHAVVHLSNSSSYICRIFHQDLLQAGCCLLDRTVQYSTTKTALNPVELKLIRFDVIPAIKHIKTVKVTVVLRNIEDAKIWRDRQVLYLPLLRQLLQLLIISGGSLLKFKDFEAAQSLGVHMIEVRDIGSPTFGKVVKSTKIIIEELVSWERYSLRCHQVGFKIAGNSEAFKQLTCFISRREQFIGNPLAQNLNFSQLMIIGPPGSGKKTLTKKAASECNAVVVTFDCASTANTKRNQRPNSENPIEDAFKHASLLTLEGPVVLLILNIELICRKPGWQLSAMNNMLDAISQLHRLIVISTSSDPNAIHPSVKIGTRLNEVIYLGVPSEQERVDMLKMLCDEDFALGNEEWLELGRMTPGYVLSDLALVVSLTRRTLFHLDENSVSSYELLKKAVVSIEPTSVKGELGLVKCDASIDQIGGLKVIKDFLYQAVQWPLFKGEAFRRLNIKPSSGILLYGPPGCAKTSLARAIAAESHVTFLSVSAADLYSPYVGDTELIISSLFRRARAAAPTLLFIDEIDALVGNRNGELKKSQGRVLSSFLVEMDGIGVNAESEFLSDPITQRIIIVAATNRPQVIDAALLRPGRLDKLIYVPPPELEDRLNILEVVTKKMPLDDDVSLRCIAKKTELYSGADLTNLCREAALSGMTSRGVDTEKIVQLDFLEALKTSQPSLHSTQIEWYEKFSFS